MKGRKAEESWAVCPSVGKASNKMRWEMANVSGWCVLFGSFGVLIGLVCRERDVCGGVIDSIVAPKSNDFLQFRACRRTSPPYKNVISIKTPQKPTIIMYNVAEETPVDTCYRVQCDKCGKTTWKVEYTPFPMTPLFSHFVTRTGMWEPR